VNRLARGYRNSSGANFLTQRWIPSCKPSSSWKGGKKTLVFVRRVASVKELKRKLDERYDQWLHGRLRWNCQQCTSPPRSGDPAYSEERTLFLQTEEATQAFSAERVTSPRMKRGGIHSSPVLPGEGPRGFASGANVQKRFINRSSHLPPSSRIYCADILAVGLAR